MTLMNGTSKLAAAVVAVMLLGAGCGAASPQTDTSPAPTDAANFGVDGSDLSGVRLDVRRDPG